MSTQVSYIVGLLAAGLVMGMVFDVYNTVTGASKWLKWLRPTLDIAFWTSSAIAVFYVLFRTDNGRIRIYTFLLLLTGYFIYRVTLHRTVVGSAFAIVRFLRAAVLGTYRIVYTLTVRPIKGILRVLFAILRALYAILCVVESWVFHIVRFWLNVTLIRWLARLPVMQRVFTRIQASWEELWMRASNWLRGKWERG